jgi:ankyrin repeat protein
VRVDAVRRLTDQTVLTKVALEDKDVDVCSAAIAKLVPHVDDLEALKVLLRAKPGVVFTKDDDGKTALHWAASKGHKDVAELLLANKADVNAKENHDQTPLYYAAGAGHKDLVELLLSHGADVKAKDRNGATPLHNAAFRGHRDIAEVLLAHGAYVDARDSNFATPLHNAASRGYRDVAELLLLNFAYVDAKDRNGATPLHNATSRGYSDVMELLLAHGADANARDGKGATPSQLAAANSYKNKARDDGNEAASPVTPGGAPAISISRDASGRTTTFLAGQMSVPKGLTGMFPTIDNNTFTCTLLRPLRDGDVLAAMVSTAEARSIEKAAGYPVLAVITASDGGLRAFMPAVLTFKADIEAHAVLRADGFEIETARSIKAGTPIPVLYVNGPVILSAEVVEDRTESTRGGQSTPLLSVFLSGSQNRAATIGAWRIEKGLP